MKNLHYANLLDYYKNILSKKQAEALTLYYNDDCSLSEIAEQLGITRQGVRDYIKRGEAELDLLEEKIGLIKKLKSIEQKVEDAKNTVKNTLDEDKILNELDKIIEEIYL